MTVDFTALATPGVRALRPYVPGKPIEELERELGISNSLKLASNENPLGASPQAMAAVKRAADQLHLYPDDIGFRLRHRLAKQHGLAAEQLLLGAGSSDVIDMVVRSLLGPGRNAVFSQYAFAMYPIYTQAAGAEGRVAPALPPDHAQMPYGHDLQAMADLVDANTRVLFIANPNNPTGTWLGAEPLYGFIRSLPGDLVVVLDEAYIEYVEQPDFPDGRAWLAEFPNLIVTRTFSKIHGLAALRVGYGMASAELISLIGRVRHPFNVNSLAQVAAEAALEDEGFVRQSLASNSAGLAQLEQGLTELGLGCIPSVGNFLSFDLQRPAAPIYQALLREGVILRPLAGYDMPRHLRVTVGTWQENQRFLEALKRVLQAC
ncbi:MAG: histidinol-phosphate transaminase [Gammaproteobacteria bacterium SHHR-1]|uniref:histidinol-phosphate transaminase n=1 Tax=Magnetovirga frankeli TaxID=947516 RepID=UPI0012935CA7|nr:histidinol-phosphate transaminase [gamma proteobacterium SS-5]